jgi:hypothetical protein
VIPHLTITDGASEDIAVQARADVELYLPIEATVSKVKTGSGLRLILASFRSGSQVLRPGSSRSDDAALGTGRRIPRPPARLAG